MTPSLNFRQLPAILYAVAVIVVIIFITAILKKIGVFKTRQDRIEEKDAAMLETLDYFNPVFWEGKQFKDLPAAMQDKIARMIHKSVSGPGTDEELLYSAFSQLFNRVNISQVASRYYKIYGDDMKSDIFDDIDTEERAKLYKIINNLPKF